MHTILPLSLKHKHKQTPTISHTHKNYTVAHCLFHYIYCRLYSSDSLFVSFTRDEQPDKTDMQPDRQRDIVWAQCLRMGPEPQNYPVLFILGVVNPALPACCSLCGSSGSGFLLLLFHFLPISPYTTTPTTTTTTRLIAPTPNDHGSHPLIPKNVVVVVVLFALLACCLL